MCPAAALESVSFLEQRRPQQLQFCAPGILLYLRHFLPFTRASATLSPALLEGSSHRCISSLTSTLGFCSPPPSPYLYRRHLPLSPPMSPLGSSHPCQFLDPVKEGTLKLPVEEALLAPDLHEERKMMSLFSLGCQRWGVGVRSLVPIPES